MRLMFVLLGILLALSLASASDNSQVDQVTLKKENEGLRKQGVLKTEPDSTETTKSSDTATEKNKGTATDAKGDLGDPPQNGEGNTDKADNIDDDLQYLSAAQVDNKGGEKSQAETTENHERGEDMSEQEEEEDDTENEEEEEEEEDDSTAAPFDKSHKKQVVLGRGVGALGDLMFQYATVSSIARSSKRRPIFSSAFTPLLTVFPHAPIVIIEDEEIVQLQPLTNITLSDTEISFDSVKQDIPDEGSVEIVGQTQSWKYFHVILNSLRNELSPAQFYIEAADDYLEEVMRRAVKNKLKKSATNDYKKGDQKENGENEIKEEDKGFLKYVSKEEKNTGKETKKSEGKTEDANSNVGEEEPKSIIEQMKSPGDEITLVGIHLPTMFVVDEKEMDKEDVSKDETEKREEKRKEKEKAVLSYFNSAMDYYRDEHSISGDFVQFVVVCEHLRWCIDHLNGPGVHFAIGGSAELDLSILARCDHAILTPSSLSWWSAWLAGGQVVYPATLSEMSGVLLDDYVFPDWTEI